MTGSERRVHAPLALLPEGWARDVTMTIDARGFFTPNVEGPNPERSGSRNNFGDVRVIGTYSGEGTTKALKGTSHLIVTVPLYVRWAQMEIFRD